MVRDRIGEAYALAMEAHDGQTYQNEPYVVHPRRVSKLLHDRGVSDEDYIIVALLHDVVEDCQGYSVFAIRQQFGDRVADAVDAITRRKGENYYKEGEDSYLRRVAANPIAREVKIADMADNMLMTRSPNCPPEKKRLWLKYMNAILFLLKTEMNEQE